MNIAANYVVLYMDDTITAANFWVEQVGFYEMKRIEFNNHYIITVRSKNQTTCFELVPLKLMEDNPYILNLKMPSIALSTPNLEQTRQHLIIA